MKTRLFPCMLAALVITCATTTMLRAQTGISEVSSLRQLRIEFGFLPNASNPQLGLGAAYQFENYESIGFQAKLTTWQSVPGMRTSSSARTHMVTRLSASAGKTTRQGPFDIAMYAGLAMDVLFRDGSGSEEGGINPIIELRASIPYNDRIAFSLGLEKLVSLFSTPVVTTQPFEIKAGIGWRL